MKYENLLKPVKIGNVLLRNRMIATPSNPHFVQGPEKYPTEPLITHYANKAKAGAAIVTCKGNNPVKNKDPHSLSLDIHNGAHQHYFAQIADCVHYYGAKASYLVLPPMGMLEGYDASDGILSEFVAGDGSVATLGKAAPKDLLYEVIDQYVEEAKLAKSLGFDMCFMHMAYRFMFPGRFISPLSNHRTDEFGGDIEGRSRFPLLICEGIKKACGKDFLVEISISGREDDMFKGGSTVEDAIAFAKLAEGKVDLLQIRGGSIDPSQPTYLDEREIPQLEPAAAIKKGVEAYGGNIKIVTVGGCQDLDTCENVIAEGKADFIGAARAWIADPAWAEKAYEGRGDDVAPCLRCNKCHQASPGNWLTVCSVNPEWGLESKIDRMVTVPDRKKKIAVVGGGVGGMESALLLAKRGHDVTLYEKEDHLGGLLCAMDGIGIKWTITKFKEYLIRQVEKSNVKVLLNTAATPELLKSEGYDEVFAALGSTPIIPPIPGVDSKNVCPAIDVVKEEPGMGENVAIIGGGDIGVEMGIYLARKGHKVTVIEMLDKLAPEAVPVHFRSMFEQTWENQEGFSYLLNSRVTAIEDGAVRYADSDGNEHIIPADSVVIAAGMKGRTDEAMSFSELGCRVRFVGDCNKVGSIQTAMRSAYSQANNT
ncbi:MAG: FAD-binding protein [Ruminococcaceae bacterium]|nr:FAD-binding protein [Oscillospiraceae bacterium]